MANSNDNDLAAAVADFDKAISLAASEGLPYVNRGLAKLALKDASACEDFITATKLGNDAGQRNYAAYCQQKQPETPGVKIDKRRLAEPTLRVRNYPRLTQKEEKKY